MASARAAASHPQELVSLKEAFAGKCRIIDDVGEFKHVVTIKRNNSDLAYKFQITGDYPAGAPHIAIKSSQLTDHDKAELSQYLKIKAMATPNQPILATLVKLADSWLKDQNLEYVFIEAEEPEKKSPKKGKKKPKKKDKPEEVIEEKKCSMKMAEDVIKRIQWDSALPTEEFIVGYLDRFVGIVEKVFSAFSWEDLASVDYDELAIPQHRIQYFKYKNEKVWDKNKRLDNFFGSTGSKRTIMDVIAEYKEPEKTQAGVSEDDSDDDQEVTVHTGFSAAAGAVQEQKAPIEGEFEGPRARELYWGPKKRPTHFICLRMTDSHIRRMTKNVQDTVQALEPEFANSFIPVERLHITLACIGLDTHEDINKACKVMNTFETSLKEMNPQNIEIQLNGIGNFFDNVLYAKVARNDDFMDFVELLRSLLIAEDIEIRDVFEFNPHMTILKFKKAAQKEKKTRCMLDSRIYEAVESPYFGKQVVSNMHLCVMSEECEANGFYITPAKIAFKEKSET